MIDSNEYAIVGSYQSSGGGDDGWVYTVTIGCKADTDSSGAIDVDDLINVILDWGTDGSGNNGDVVIDGNVNVDDLVTVIISWGACPGGTAGSTLASEVSSAADVDFTDWLTSIGCWSDKTCADSVHKNHANWWRHYFDSHTSVFPPDACGHCAGSDPFGNH